MTGARRDFQTALCGLDEETAQLLQPPSADCTRSVAGVFRICQEGRNSDAQLYTNPR